MKNILIIDDDYDICFLLSKLLTQHKFEVFTATTAKKGLAIVQDKPIDLILCDYRLDGMNGNALMTQIKADKDIPVIIITALNDIRTAISTIKNGAFDYIVKPLRPEEILHTVESALKSSEEYDTQASDGPGDSAQPGKKGSDLVFNDSQYLTGTSSAFKIIMHQISLVAPTDYSVIIYGESGTGKEAIAKEIHKQSKRSQQPFVAIDCGTLSKELAGSELFGHEKGSFTGAIQQKMGSFELANNGTIFLDEVANLSYDVQVSLLRVIQERKMKRIGGNNSIDLNVRVIIASNENLWDASREGKFREDLYHRFNEFTMHVPPLRERKEDIPVFAHCFLQLANALLKKNIESFTPAAMDVLLNYYWPGNLRELKNVVKRAALMAEDHMISYNNIPSDISGAVKSDQDETRNPALHEPESRIGNTRSHEEQDAYKEIQSLKKATIDHDYALIIKTLTENNYNKSKTAKILKIDRKTLYNKISMYKAMMQENS